MSPRAIYCPTCGCRGPVGIGIDVTPKSNLGWKIVQIFWSVVIVGIAMVTIFA